MWSWLFLTNHLLDPNTYLLSQLPSYLSPLSLSQKLKSKQTKQTKYQKKKTQLKQKVHLVCSVLTIYSWLWSLDKLWLWLTHPVTLQWTKLMFSFPLNYQLQIASIWGGNLCTLSICSNGIWVTWLCRSTHAAYSSVSTYVHQSYCVWSLGSHIMKNA